MKNLAKEIQCRANKQNVSISELCRMTGISRRWFECFKKRTPKSMEIYLKIDEQLKILEQKNQNNKDNETN